jgi:hypothetical protein
MLEFACYFQNLNYSVISLRQAYECKGREDCCFLYSRLGSKLGNILIYSFTISSSRFICMFFYSPTYFLFMLFDFPLLATPCISTVSLLKLAFMKIPY